MSVPHRRRSRLAGQFAWVAGGRAVAAALQAVTLVLLARALGPGDFGHVAAFLGVVTIAQVVVDLGLSTLVTRERAASPSSPVVWAALRLTKVTALGIFAAVSIALLLAGSFIDPVYLLLAPLALWAAAERNADVWLSIAFADGDAKINVLNIVGRRAFLIVLFACLSLTSTNPALAFSSASGIAAVVANLAARWSVRGRVAKSKGAIVNSEVFRLARPYWANSVAAQAVNLDAAIVGAISGSYQASLYATASRLTTPLKIFPASLASVIIPHTARHSSSRVHVVRTFKLCFFASIAIAIFYFIGAALAPLFVVPILGVAYESATPIVVIVLLGLPLSGASALFGGALQGVGRARDVARAAIAGTTTCLLGLTVLTPAFDAVGAAVALVISFAVQLAVLAFSARAALGSMTSD